MRHEGRRVGALYHRAPRASYSITDRYLGTVDLAVAPFTHAACDCLPAGSFDVMPVI